MSLFSSQPSIPARVLTEAEWIELEETPYNPPSPELSEDDFEAEFDAAETGLIAVLEHFGRNAAAGGDFIHDWTVPDGSRGICFEILHRSKLRTPRLIPSLLEFLHSLPQSYSIGMSSDQFTDYIYVRREGVLVYECSRRTMRAFGLTKGN
jgi:hypothetical protein